SSRAGESFSRRRTRGLHDRARPQPRYRALHAPPRARRDAFGPYTRRSRTDSVLRFANQEVPANWQTVLRRTKSLWRLLHLHQSRTRDVPAACPDKLPARGIAFQTDAVDRVIADLQ